MAIKHERGWVWEPSEKRGLSAALRRLRKDAQAVVELVRRFRAQIPALAEDAAEAARPFLERCRELGDIDCRANGRKYQPLSPQEVASRIRRMAEDISSWTAFIRRPDVVEAVRRNNRAAAQAEADYRNQIAEQLADPALPGRLLDQWKLWKLYPYGDAVERCNRAEVDRLRLDRLLDVRLLRYCTHDHPTLRQKVVGLLAEGGPDCLRRALEAAVQALIAQEADQFRRDGPSPLGVGWQSASAFEHVVATVGHEIRDGRLNPAAIPDEELSLFGADCTPGVVCKPHSTAAAG